MPHSLKGESTPLYELCLFAKILLDLVVVSVFCLVKWGIKDAGESAIVWDKSLGAADFGGRGVLKEFDGLDTGDTCLLPAHRKYART